MRAAPFLILLALLAIQDAHGVHRFRAMRTDSSLEVEGGKDSECCGKAGTCQSTANACVFVDGKNSGCDKGLWCCVPEDKLKKASQAGCKATQVKSAPAQQQQAQVRLEAWTERSKSKVDDDVDDEIAKAKKCKDDEAVRDGDKMGQNLEKKKGVPYTVADYQYPGGVPIGDCCGIARALANEAKPDANVQFMLGVAIINGRYYFATSKAGIDESGKFSKLKGWNDARKLNTVTMEKLMAEAHGGNDWGCAAPWLFGAARYEGKNVPITCMAEIYLNKKDNQILASSCANCLGALQKLNGLLQTRT